MFAVLGESDSISSSIATDESGQNKGGELVIIVSLISDPLVGSINLVWYMNAFSLDNHDSSNDAKESVGDNGSNVSHKRRQFRSTKVGIPFWLPEQRKDEEITG